MPEIGGKNVAGSGYTLIDWLGVGASKRITESVLSPFIGNSTYMSGFLKIGGAIALDMARPKSGMAGKIGEYATGGLVIDGVEDIMVNLLGANPLGGITGNNQGDGNIYV